MADAALARLNAEARRRSAPTAIVYAGLNAGHAVVDLVLRLPAPPERSLCLEDVDGTLRPIQFETVEKLRIAHTDCAVACWEGRGSILHGTHYFVEEADLGGGYHFEPLANDVRRDTRGGKARVRRLSAGPLRSRLEVRTQLRVPREYDRQARTRIGACVITLTSILTLEAGSDQLRIVTTIENPAGNQRLRLILPTGLRTTEVHADASFAVHANNPERWPADAGQNSHPLRSFVDIADTGGGLAFRGKGIREYEIVPRPEGTELEVTLLRSVDFVFLCGTWQTPGAQLRGRVTHEYALRLHDGDWRTGQVAESAAAFLNPAVVNVTGDSLHPNEGHDHATTGFYADRDGVEIPVDTNRSPWHFTNAHRDGWRRVEPGRFPDVAVPAKIAPFTLEGAHLIVSAFKRAQDGRGEIVRFWSAAEAEQRVTLRAGFSDAQLTRVDLREQTVPTESNSQGTLVLRVRPFEIVTVRMERMRTDWPVTGEIGTGQNELEII